MKPLVHFFSVLCLVALVMSLLGSKKVEPIERTPPWWATLSGTNLEYVTQWGTEIEALEISQADGAKTPRLTEMVDAGPLAAPLNPDPGATFRGERGPDQLSIRGLYLGMSEKEAELSKPQARVDRLKTYWQWDREQAQESARTWDFGATWLEYGEYFGSFTLDGLCGAAYGNGLERRGVPILAKGDSGDDVTRLLGLPTLAGRSNSDRDGRTTHWSYPYDDWKLVVYFHEGRVESFTLKRDDFADSGC